MRYLINPDHDVKKTSSRNTQPIWEAMIEEFDRQGPRGVADFSLVGLSMKHGRGEYRGNRKFVDHIIEKGWILPVDQQVH